LHAQLYRIRDLTTPEHTIDGPGGRALRVREAGALDGVPVIVHHGTPGSRMFRERWVADATERGIRMIGFDRPGYGGSDRNHGRSVADVAADVEAICDALELDRVLTHGSSGGGPHALACAALLPGRVVAAATLCSVGPFDADDLDFLAGMGEDNVEELGAALQGEEVLAPLVEALTEQVLGADPDELAEQLESILSPPDVAVVNGGLARELLASMGEGVGATRAGWIDDDLAFVRPWGFDLASISVPTLLWQGRQDLMVPAAHGEWLAEHVPGVEAHLSDEDGHLSIEQARIGDVHAWLLERY
jgi:pimeloyl-ACP methyl ester carboxylesterase